MDQFNGFPAGLIEERYTKIYAVSCKSGEFEQKRGKHGRKAFWQDSVDKRAGTLHAYKCGGEHDKEDD